MTDHWCVACARLLVLRFSRRCARAQRLAFAHGKSDVVAKADGTWLPPDKRAKAVHGAGACARVGCLSGTMTDALRASHHAARPARGARAPSEEHDDEAGAAAGAAAAAAAAAGQPNKILFVEGLPEATTSSMLAMLFQQFPGCALVLCAPGALRSRSRRQVCRGAHGGGQAWDRLRGVPDGVAGWRGAHRAGWLQDHAHAQHGGAIRAALSHPWHRSPLPRYRLCARDSVCCNGRSIAHLERRRAPAPWQRSGVGSLVGLDQTGAPPPELHSPLARVRC